MLLSLNPFFSDSYNKHSAVLFSAANENKGYYWENHHTAHTAFL
jgi:hypothetical protein